MGSTPWIAPGYLSGKKIGSHALPVFASGARFFSAVPDLLKPSVAPDPRSKFVPRVGWNWGDLEGFQRCDFQ